LSQFAGGKNGGWTRGGHALDSIDFQGISQFMIRLTEIRSEKIWVMTRAEATVLMKLPAGV
jgi:hypothetical protein